MLGHRLGDVSWQRVALRRSRKRDSALPVGEPPALPEGGRVTVLASLTRRVSWTL